MPRYAKIKYGEVREIGIFPDIINRFHPSLTWVECPENVVEGYLYDGSDFKKVEKVLSYADKRKEEYPSIEECVHAILDGELDDLQIKRQAVKNKYPKEI